MDKALKALWVEALRSGKYKQGKGQLRNSRNQFCCLGVLADQICPTAWAKNSEGQQEWFGAHAYFPAPDLRGLEHDVQKTLAEMNDGAAEDGTQPRKSFEEIADYIEKHL